MYFLFNVDRIKFLLKMGIERIGNFPLSMSRFPISGVAQARWDELKAMAASMDQDLIIEQLRFLGKPDKDQMEYLKKNWPEKAEYIEWACTRHNIESGEGNLLKMAAEIPKPFNMILKESLQFSPEKRVSAEK